MINGAFLRVLSLGLAVIFGLLNIINFTMARNTCWARLRVVSVEHPRARLLAGAYLGAVIVGASDRDRARACCANLLGSTTSMACS